MRLEVRGGGRGAVPSPRGAHRSQQEADVTHRGDSDVIC